VRITLTEKNLDWVSHPIDIPKNEHATPEYQAIHPKGLVPAFVDNGTLVIESCDIIDYIDQKYTSPPLRPSDPATDSKMGEVGGCRQSSNGLEASLARVSLSAAQANVRR
jgi:glutathione S-transferase